ncbi:MAG: DUF1828 domain-containing protein [Candidatus Stahlbacteria bacterium]|nr:DUF1828 domain-containing protein [Candidatus Stahlbacteria bacterium]
MNIKTILENLKEEFNDRISFKEKRKNIYQLIIPIYYEDGDMMDIYIQLLENGRIKVCDFGKTLMHLSYSFDIDTDNKEKIFNQILSQNHIENNDGNLYIDTNSNNLYSSVMQLSQVMAKISNMRLYKREVIKSLFFELFAEFVTTKLQKYEPIPDYYPIDRHEEYKVDFRFNHCPRPIFLFGVPDSAHARLTTISCLKFQTEKIAFRSVAVLESLDSLSRKDQARLMSASDKEFSSLDDFQENAPNYLEREFNTI